MQRLRIGAQIGGLALATLLIAIALSPENSAAFEASEYAWEDPVHQWITDRGLPFIRSGPLMEIKWGNSNQDCREDDLPSFHFVRCMFSDSAAYINTQYGRIGNYLFQSPPSVWEAAYEFGQLLHGAQDFYAHSNWVEIWTTKGKYHSDDNGDTVSDRPTDYFLYEPGFGLWPTPDDWSIWSPDTGGLTRLFNPANIIIAQTTNDFLPQGWTATPHRQDTNAARSRVPTIIRANETAVYDALMTTPDTPGGRSYSAFNIDHDDLNKDNSEKRFYEDAYWNAVEQTRHEWVRLLNLLKKDGFEKGIGFAEASAALGFFLKSDAVSPDGILRTETFPIQVTVSIQSMAVRGISGGDFGLAFVLYTGDFQHSAQRESYYASLPSARPAPLTLGVSPTDTLVMTVQGWEKSLGSPTFDLKEEWDGSVTRDMPLAGVSLALDGPRFSPGLHRVTSANFDVTFKVEVVGRPIADAGPDQTIMTLNPEGAQVTLNGAGSTDPDGGTLSYEWTWGSGGSAYGRNPTALFAVGSTTVTLTVSDGASSATDQVVITIANPIMVTGTPTPKTKAVPTQQPFGQTGKTPEPPPIVTPTATQEAAPGPSQTAGPISAASEASQSNKSPMIFGIIAGVVVTGLVLTVILRRRNVR